MDPGFFLLGNASKEHGHNFTCKSFVFADVGSNTDLQVGIFFLGLVQVIVFAYIMFWQLRGRRKVVRHGQYNTGVLLVPPYTTFIYLFAGTLLLYGVLNIVYDTRPYISHYRIDESVLWGLGNWYYHAVLDGLAIFLCFEGIGSKSMKKTRWRSLLFGFFIGSLVALASTAYYWAPNHNLLYGVFIQCISEGILFLFYLLILILPKSWLKRRAAVYPYATCWAIYHPIHLTLLILMYFEYDVSYCVYVGSTTLVWGIFKPVIFFNTLKYDQNYFLGRIRMKTTSTKSNQQRLSRCWWPCISCCIGCCRKHTSDSYAAIATRTTASLSSSTEDVFDSDVGEEEDETIPLVNNVSMEVDPMLAMVLGYEVDAISEQCKMINYYELRQKKVDKKLTEQERQQRRIMGAGMEGRVYKCNYNGKPVAVKILYCMNLTQETIRNFCEENKLLCGIRHPNIVKMEGVCIYPPNIASVMELCHGNLQEWLGALADSESTLGDRLPVAIDCARGVEYIHSLGIVHCDIKSLNFVIGQEAVSKWNQRDIEIWLRGNGFEKFISAFRRHQIQQGSGSLAHLGLCQLDDADKLKRVLGQKELSVEGLRLLGEINKLANYILERGQRPIAKLIDVSSSRFVKYAGLSKSTERYISERISTKDRFTSPYGGTEQWMSPEQHSCLLNQSPYMPTFESDVYSLALVLWEILTGKIPFVDTHGKISDLVLSNHRPQIPEVSRGTEYAQLLQDAWHQDPKKRPRSKLVLRKLENMLRAYELHRTIETRELLGKIRHHLSEEDFDMVRRMGSFDRPLDSRTSHSMAFSNATVETHTEHMSSISSNASGGKTHHTPRRIGQKKRVLPRSLADDRKQGAKSLVYTRRNQSFDDTIVHQRPLTRQISNHNRSLSHGANLGQRVSSSDESDALTPIALSNVSGIDDKALIQRDALLNEQDPETQVLLDFQPNSLSNQSVDTNDYENNYDEAPM